MIKPPMTQTKKWSLRLRGEAHQFFILTRHFFNRFFRNDVVDFEDQMKEKVIAGMVFLIILGGHIANSILLKYVLFLDDPESWVEKSYFILFFMALLGFITVIEWDVIFPDQRDYSNLIPLPVKIRTFFLAKFASFSVFVALYSVAVNILGGCAFAYYLAQFHSQGVIYFFRYFLAHMISASAANFFIFFLCVLIQGILMCFFSYNLYRKISLFFRFLLLTLFISLILFSVTESVSISRSLSSLPEMKESNPVFLHFFPPMWFVGIYEILLGHRDPFFEVLANFAVLALLATILAFFIASRISYYRHLKRSPEVKRGFVYLKKTRQVLSAVFNGIFLRNLSQRAIFYFFGQTLSRSTPHKVRLFGYMSVSSGLVLILLASVKTGLRQGPVFSKTLLAIPLILSFFLLLGLRVLASIPSSLEANWVFRITEQKQRRHYFAGFRKGLFFCALLPLFLALFVLYFCLWGWKAALLHCLYGLTASWLLLEILFFKYHKIPFASTYVPGKAKIHLFWLVYVIAFLVYILTFSSLERVLFLRPRFFYFFYAIMGLIFLALKVYKDYFLTEKTAIVYDEEPEPVMVSL
jgi:hypothetical protein